MCLGIGRKKTTFLNKNSPERRKNAYVYSYPFSLNKALSLCLTGDCWGLIRTKHQLVSNDMFQESPYFENGKWLKMYTLCLLIFFISLHLYEHLQYLHKPDRCIAGTFAHAKPPKPVAPTSREPSSLSNQCKPIASTINTRWSLHKYINCLMKIALDSPWTFYFSLFLSWKKITNILVCFSLCFKHGHLGNLVFAVFWRKPAVASCNVQVFRKKWQISNISLILGWQGPTPSHTQNIYLGNLL